MEETQRHIVDVFYDFERDHEDSHEQNWQNNVPSFHFTRRKSGNFGLMLIDHGTFAIPVGYGNIYLISNGKLANDYFCPSCREKYTKLEGCAFSNCYYKIKGRKFNGTIVTVPWRRIDDKLRVYDNKEKLALWKDLKLECRRLSDPPFEDDDF
jgi:hypothetical protein